MNGPAVQLRGDRLRERIALVSLDAFLSRGFAGASIDEITAAAGVSKRTIYAHFGDKEGLFLAAVEATIVPMQQGLERRLELADQGDLASTLRALCRGLADIVVTTQVARVRRLVIGEAERFPELAARWYALGPQQTVDRLADFLATVVDHPDPARAAEQLLWLTVAPLNRLMFDPSARIDPLFVEAAADDAADLCARAWNPGR